MPLNPISVLPALEPRLHTTCCHIPFTRITRTGYTCLWGLCLLFLTSCGTLFRGTTDDGGSRGWTTSRGQRAEVSEENQERSYQEYTPPPGTSNLKSEIYESLARLSKAQADGDVSSMETALDEAMEHVRVLFNMEGAMDEAEARELYRSVITAYEEYYGVPDTLTIEFGDVYELRDEMFATLNALRQPLLEDVMLPELVPVGSVISMDKNQLVEQSIQYLLRNPERHLYRWLSRSGTYFPMIEQVLREEGVPDEIKYLAMVESGLNPRAKSRVGAGGMWQFMPATARAYGLNITHWVDERLDPEKSTRAAAKHLKDLYEQLGDWKLALAAYNCGPGRVQRAARRYKDNTGQNANFWDIYLSLPRETRNYVPMYIAAALVTSNPRTFDLRTAQPGPRYSYDLAEVTGTLDLRRAADLAGTEVETIRALNPEIRQWTTPPSSTSYMLRIPRGSYQQFAQAYAALPDDQKRGTSEYVVRRGDTLSKIARRYGTTIADLQNVNGISGSLIHEGQVLHVPVQYDAYVGAGVATNTTHIEYEVPIRTVSDDSVPVETTPTERVSERVPERETRITYRVRRGDNLSEIAQRYGVRVAQIQNWNDLSGDRIRSGQTLVLYPGDTSTVSTRGEQTVYRVKRGDNLSAIAQNYGVSVSDLKRWNNMTGDRIRVGQRLTVYSDRTAARQQWIPYYVKKGDNLSKIAQKYNATVAEVRQWNALPSDRLQIGQRLAIFVR